MSRAWTDMRADGVRLANARASKEKAACANHYHPGSALVP